MKYQTLYYILQNHIYADYLNARDQNPNQRFGGKAHVFSVWNAIRMEYAYLKILRKYVDKHHPINEARPRALKHISQYYKRPVIELIMKSPFSKCFIEWKDMNP
jgi:hypothetical protein